MPSRRIRRTDGPSREKKMWSAQHKPGMGGILPFGGRGRGGSTTVLGRPGGGGQGQVRIEHVTLYAVEDQTIAAGGGTVEWFRRGGPPTEQVGFDALATALDGGAVGDIPIDATGDLEITLDGRWGDYPDGFRCSGDLVITRTRGGLTETKTKTLTPATRTLEGVYIAWDVRAGDKISVTLPNDSGSDQTLAELEIGLRIIAVSSAASTVPTGASQQVHIYTYNDNVADYYLDGTLILAGGDLVINDFLLSVAPGDHMLSVRGEQKSIGAGSNPAAIELAIYAYDGTSDGALLFSTADTASWDCQDYPASEPAGWPDVGDSVETWTSVVSQPQAAEVANPIWSRSGATDLPVGVSYFRGFWTLA